MKETERREDKAEEGEEEEMREREEEGYQVFQEAKKSGTCKRIHPWAAGLRGYPNSHKIHMYSLLIILLISISCNSFSCFSIIRVEVPAFSPYSRMPDPHVGQNSRVSLVPDPLSPTCFFVSPFSILKLFFSIFAVIPKADPVNF